MSSKSFIIALDGPAGCGKSSTAREVAKRLHFTFLDTGAMYRAVTLYVLRKGVMPENEFAVNKLLPEIQLHFSLQEGNPRIHLNGEDVEDQVRTHEVAQNVSAVSKHTEVRRFLVAQQQEIGEQGNLVAEGRDIGTVVFPDAPLKVFVTARPEVRAQRRAEELRAKGVEADISTVLTNLLERDAIDSGRTDSPLRKAKDAIVLDTSDTTFEEQVQFVIKHALALQEKV